MRQRDERGVQLFAVKSAGRLSRNTPRPERTSSLRQLLQQAVERREIQSLRGSASWSDERTHLHRSNELQIGGRLAGRGALQDARSGALIDSCAPASCRPGAGAGRNSRRTWHRAARLHKKGSRSVGRRRVRVGHLAGRAELSYKQRTGRAPCGEDANGMGEAGRCRKTASASGIQVQLGILHSRRATGGERLESVRWHPAGHELLGPYRRRRAADWAGNADTELGSQLSGPGRLNGC